MQHPVNSTCCLLLTLLQSGAESPHPTPGVSQQQVKGKAEWRVELMLLPKVEARNWEVGKKNAGDRADKKEI